MRLRHLAELSGADPTIGAIAARSGLAESTVSRAVRDGAGAVRPTTVTALAAGLGVSVDVIRSALAREEAPCG